MNITDLRNNRANLWNEMERFLDTHRGEDGTLSAEDDATYASMEGRMDALTNEIARQERHDALAASLAMPVSDPIRTDPSAHDAATGRASREYAEDFGRHLRGRAPLSNVLSEYADAEDGGYLVPEEFERRIVAGLEANNVVRTLANVITTTSERKIPVATSHSVAAWKAENAAYAESNPTFGTKTIDAHKLTDLLRVSVELLQDSAFDLEAYIADEIARAFGVAEESAFCTGDGAGKPTGIFTAAGGTPAVTAAKAADITLDEVITLVYKLKAPYRANAAFLMNDSTVSIVRKIKDGNGAYLWEPSTKAGEPDKLLGYDLHTTAYAPEAAAGNYAIAFGDFRNYWVADRAGRTVQRLNELYATNGQVGFVATERVDGKVILAEGIQLLKMHA